MSQVPLGPHVTRDAVDSAAREAGWALVNVLPATDQHPAQRIFLAGDRAHFIYVVDDPRLGPPYAVVQGPDAPRWEAEVKAWLVGSGS